MNISKYIGESTNGLKRIGQSAVMTIALIGLTLPLVGCGSKTTLDRIGQVAVTAAFAYQTQLDSLLAGGSISQEQYNKLKPGADAALLNAKEFAAVVSGFAEIAPGDVPRITLQISNLVSVFRNTLQNAALGGLAPTSLPVRILQYGIDTLLAASIVFAGLFPPPTVQSATRGNGIPPAKKNLKVTKLQLPATSKDVKGAMEAAGQKVAAAYGIKLADAIAD